MIRKFPRQTSPASVLSQKCLRLNATPRWGQVRLPYCSMTGLSRVSSCLTRTFPTSVGKAARPQVREVISHQKRLSLSTRASAQDSEAAAEMLRAHWGIGELPVKNMIALLESRGIRVYSLAIDAKEVDAFSMWKGGRPFVFLNTFKSAEHCRFDAAREIGPSGDAPACAAARP